MRKFPCYHVKEIKFPTMLALQLQFHSKNKYSSVNLPFLSFFWPSQRHAWLCMLSHYCVYRCPVLFQETMHFTKQQKLMSYEFSMWVQQALWICRKNTPAVQIRYPNCVEIFLISLNRYSAGIKNWFPQTRIPHPYIKYPVFINQENRKKDGNSKKISFF